MARCERLCRDIADLASPHARMLLPGSDLQAWAARACAEACDRCAAECRRHEEEHCRYCAQVLRDCAASCRAMAS